MEPMDKCHCCLQRPSENDLRTPYTRLGITETYSVMLEECFVITVISSIDGKSGICEVCVERLREACLFKMQVEQCQAELQAKLATELNVKAEEPQSPCSEDLHDGPLLHEEVIIKSDVDEDSAAAAALDMMPDGDKDSPADIEVNAVQISSPVGDPGASKARFSTHTAQHLALACSVRLERLRSDEAPYASTTSHYEVEQVRSVEDMPPVHSVHNTPARADEQAYTCDTCGTQFTDKSGLIRHIQGHVTYTQTLAVRNVYCCDVCSELFTSKYRLIRHIRTHTHPKKYVHEKMLSGAKSYKCKKCNKQFSYKNALKRHQLLHSGIKPFKCNECRMTFNRKDNLETHMRIHSELKYRCKECNKQFSEKNQLELHKIIHRGKKPFQCKECNEQFAFKCHLEVHERNHSGVKVYKCKECNMQFAHKCHLDIHERTHSGLKPYKCKECNKSYTHQFALKRHKRIHSRVKPYKCNECNNEFTRKDSLDVHTRIHRRLKSCR